VGCGIVASVRKGRLVTVEGDPEHPINRGALCSKGLALPQVVNNERRLRSVLYRPPGGADWEVKSWEWVLPRIARLVKKTRDEHWLDRREGKLVNRTEAIASLGGAALNNEECYAIAKALRSLGVVFLEHQARICHSSTVAGLAETFGRGAMTNHWIDIANSDAILIIGSNMAENHPCGFRWVIEAMDRGAKMICVDPRLTRTASVADVYVPMRSGADIAFIGGSLLDFGSQNLIEAAACGTPILLGPSTRNFADAAREAVACGAALSVSSADDLVMQVNGLLSNARRRQAMGAAGRAFAERHRGATALTMDLIKSVKKS